MAEKIISHALVLPDKNFMEWLDATRAYTKAFERVAVIRSPAGNDLNRYRNVTAVEAPLTWYKDNALEHVRRFYPSVVRVDVIRAKSPGELWPILNARIQADDRYGEKQNTPVHIYDRFVLDWPTDYRPMRILRKFQDKPGIDQDNEGVDVASVEGSVVRAAVAGKVTRQWEARTPDETGYANYMQVTSSAGGHLYVITYMGINRLAVPLGADVALGDELGRAMGTSFKIVVQRPGGGLTGFRLPDILDPTPMIYVSGFRVTPTTNGLRVRKLPDTRDGEVLGQVHTFDELESLEPHGRTLAKLGVENQWLRVRMPDGTEGYTAAWYLKAIQKGREGVFPGVNLLGVNLDALHPLGTPKPNLLGKLGWVRFGYNVSNNTGSEDIQAAFERYAPLAEQYVRAGYKVLFTTSHQTYGEGKNEYWPWNQMNDDKWNRLIANFADMMGFIAQQWAGTELVHAWQVWNEQDAPIGATASVPMLSHNYAKMLTQTIRAIRASDPDIYIITGGHTGGPDRGADYARNTLNLMPFGVRPDGIAFHPYGRGLDPGTRYAQFGHIDESVRKYGLIMPDKPLWITEWGILDRPTDSPQDVANYAVNMVRHIKSRYPGRIATMIWYAWAQSMHNGYGIVDTQGKPRPPLTENFITA